jgi:fructan beta-fructosidase
MKYPIFKIAILSLIILASCKKASSPTNAVNPVIPDTTAAVAVPYRPSFHYTPNSNWINDPNGLLYYNGTYHLFSQYNPSGAIWGNMNWDQAISSDLFSWQETGLAIKEVFNTDGSTSTIFSGTAVVDSANSSGLATQAGQIPLIAIYTQNNSAANGNGISQNQNLSFSLDNGQTWTPYSGNPILDIHSTQFRDPKVFWFSPTHQWVMVVSKPDMDSIRIYNSTNLKNWVYQSSFGAIGNTNQAWECPDLFPLSVEGGLPGKWVLTLSGGGNQNGFGGMQYFIGSFDGKKFTADNLNYPLYVDFGKDYYAGISYNGISSTDGRKIMVAWANNWNYANAIPTSGYRGQYSVPRSLSLRKVNNSDGYHLLQSPVSEIVSHEVNAYSSPAKSVAGMVNLDSISGTALDIQFTLSLSNASAAGINILQGGTEMTPITFDKTLSRLSLDRTHSGRSDFSSQFASIESTTMNNIDFTNLNCRILIDQSLVEVFVNGGEYSITDLVFPTQTKGGIQLFSNGGTAVFSNISIKKVGKTLH